MTSTRLIFGENAIEKLHDVMAAFGRKVLLTYGGGSVLDCSKAIAAGAKYDGDPWDLITYKVKAQAALPIVGIPWGLQHFKIAISSVFPFGKEIR